MAKFCQQCGSPLEAGSKFCTSCGAKIAEPSAAPAPQPAPQPAPNPRPAAPKAPAKKKKGAVLVIVLVAAFLTVASIVTVCMLGFRKGGFLRPGDDHDTSDTTEVISPKDEDKIKLDAPTLGSLIDYAKKLEDLGNDEAAAAVYELIAKNGGADLIEEARKNAERADVADGIDEVDGLFSRKGDK